MHVVRCLLPYFITSLFKDKPQFLSLKYKISSIKKKIKKNFNYKYSLIKELTEINIIIYRNQFIKLLRIELQNEIIMRVGINKLRCIKLGIKLLRSMKISQNIETKIKAILFKIY